MFLKKLISSNSQATDLHQRYRAVLDSVRVVVDAHVREASNGSVAPKALLELEATMVKRIENIQHEIRLSLAFFVVPEFVESQKRGDGNREVIIGNILRRHSWVYNEKVLLVMRDVAESLPRNSSLFGPRPTDPSEIDLTFYVGLKRHFFEFLTKAGDPQFFEAPVHWTTQLYRHVTFSTPYNLSDHKTNLDIDDNNDSILFKTITAYLNADISGESADSIAKIKRKLEGELESKTIYSAKFLAIISGDSTRAPVGLARFMNSEYYSLRARVVMAILKSKNPAPIKSLLFAHQLSPHRDEHQRLVTHAYFRLFASSGMKNWDTVGHYILGSCSTTAELFQTFSGIYQWASANETYVMRRIGLTVGSESFSKNIPSFGSSMLAKLDSPVIEILFGLHLAQTVLSSEPRRDLGYRFAATILSDTLSNPNFLNDTVDCMYAFYPHVSNDLQRVMATFSVPNSKPLLARRINEVILRDLVGIKFDSCYGVPIDTPHVLSPDSAIELCDSLHRSTIDPLWVSHLLAFRQHWRTLLFEGRQLQVGDESFVAKAKLAIYKIESISYLDFNAVESHWIKFKDPKSVVTQLAAHIEETAAVPTPDSEDLTSVFRDVVITGDGANRPLARMLNTLVLSNIPLKDLDALRVQWETAFGPLSGPNSL